MNSQVFGGSSWLSKHAKDLESFSVCLIQLQAKMDRLNEKLTCRHEGCILESQKTEGCCLILASQ